MLGISKAGRVGRVLVGIGAALALFQVAAAPAQAKLPYDKDLYAAADGALAIPVAILGPGAEHVFPTGLGGGVCNPDGHEPNLTGKVGRADRSGRAPINDLKYNYTGGDVWVQDDGTVCGKLALEAKSGSIDGRKPSWVRRGAPQPRHLTLKGVTANLQIIGHGVFEPHIPAGCSLDLKLGTLRGHISASGEAKLSARKVAIAEASADRCGEAYSRLLNFGFGLPAKSGALSLDLAFGKGKGDPTPTPPTTGTTTPLPTTTLPPATTTAPAPTTTVAPTTTAPPTTVPPTTTVPTTTTTEHHHDDDHHDH